jgi:plastocyanin
MSRDRTFCMEMAALLLSMSMMSWQVVAADRGGPGTLEGQLELAPGAQQAVEADEVSDGVVYFLPKAGAPAPKPGRFTVITRSKGFSPAVLVVPVGSTVAFPNSDTILHNVYSRSPTNGFDFGFYGPGQNRQHVFTRPGLVLVNCSVHQAMRANVLVLATPYFARPGRDGRFRIPDVPEGAGTLVFWHPRGAPVSVAVDGPAKVPVQRIVATKPPLSTDRHEGHDR